MLSDLPQRPHGRMAGATVGHVAFILRRKGIQKDQICILTCSLKIGWRMG